MNARYLGIGLLAGCLVFAGPAAADPVSAVLGLFLVEKVSGPGTRDRQRPVPSWRNSLSDGERSVLAEMKRHPAITACIGLADRNNPVAAYRIRKIAQFGAEVRQRIRATGTVPEIAAVEYERPAKAFRWCGKQAGIATTSGHAALKGYALGIVHLVRANEIQQRMLAAQSGY